MTVGRPSSGVRPQADAFGGIGGAPGCAVRPPVRSHAAAKENSIYIDPGAGSLLFQMIAGLLIGWVATLGRVRRFLARLFSRGPSQK